jgi:hypothetical protein
MILYSGFRQYVSSWSLMAILFRTKCVGFSNNTLDLGVIAVWNLNLTWGNLLIH